MTGVPGAKGTPPPLTDDRAQKQDVLGLGERERDYLLAWVGENLTLVRQSVSGQRPMYWILGSVLVAGLAVHAGGFLLKASTTAEPLALVGDLIYTLGWAMWTGAVVVIFVQIWPEAKKRQYKQALDAYEAARQGRAGGGHAPDPGHDWQAAIAETAAGIRALDPLADDYDDKLTALRAKLADYQGYGRTPGPETSV